MQRDQIQTEIYTQDLLMRPTQANIAYNTLGFRQIVCSMTLLYSVVIMCYLPHVINTCTILIAGRHSSNRDLRKGCWGIWVFLKGLLFFKVMIPKTWNKLRRYIREISIP